MDRMDTATSAADLEVHGPTPGYDWAGVSAYPSVQAVARFVLGSGRIDGEPDVIGRIPVDDALFGEVERPIVVAGRLADPTRADEAVVTPEYARRRGIGVGATLSWTLLTPAELAKDRGLAPHGPTVRLTVVGIVRSPLLTDWPGSPGTVVPSAGVVSTYPANIVGPRGAAHPVVPVQALVRLRPGATTEDFNSSWRAQSAALEPVDDLGADRAVQQRIIRLDSAALAGLGVLALLVGCLVLAVAATRHVRAIAPAFERAAALGLTPGLRVAVSAVSVAAATLVGGLVGLVVAGTASSRFPIGIASLLEPTPGTHPDGAIDAVVLVVVLVVGTAVGAAAARWRPRSSAYAPRSNGLAVGVLDALDRLPTVALGARLAVERRSIGRGALGASAVLLVMVAVASGLAAGLAGDRLHQASADPARFGQTADADIAIGYAGHTVLSASGVSTTLGAIPGMRASVVDVGVTDAETYKAIEVQAFEPSSRPVGITTLHGRLPETADEVALGHGVLRALGRTIGDRVKLAGQGGPSADLMIVGDALLPVKTQGGTSDEGALVTPSAYRSLFPIFQMRAAMLAVPGGDTSVAAIQRIEDRLAAAMTVDPAHVVVGPQSTATGVAKVRALGWIPEAVAVGAVVVLLILLSQSWALTAGARARTTAILAALGVTPAGRRVVLLIQAATVALLGSVPGLVLGVAIGRAGWRSFADSVPLQYSTPQLTAMVLGPAAVAALVGVVMAGVLGWLAVKRPAVAVLRAE